MGTVTPVLLVEESQGWAQIMDLVLEAGLGRRIELAATGNAALARLTAQRPSLLVLDLDLSDLPGTEVAQLAMATYGATLPVLVISGSTHLGRQLQPLSVDGVLRKPFDCDELVATAARLLSARSSEAR